MLSSSHGGMMTLEPSAWVLTDTIRAPDMSVRCVSRQYANVAMYSPCEALVQRWSRRYASAVKKAYRNLRCSCEPASSQLLSLDTVEVRRSQSCYTAQSPLGMGSCSHWSCRFGLWSWEYRKYMICHVLLMMWRCKPCHPLLEWW